MTGPTAEQPQVTATVSPPDPPRTRWGNIPRHLGRARTSTVVLSLLFLAVGALWLNIKPDPVAPASGGGVVVEQPATPDTAVPTTPEPTPEPVPTTAAEPTTTAPEVPTTTTPETTAPTETGTPVPTTAEPSAPLPEPTSSPTG